MHGVAPYPLYWPLSQPRTPDQGRRKALFQVNFAEARQDMLFEIARLEGVTLKDVILSMNVPLRRDGLPQVPDREPADPGVAVYFARGKRPYVIACDAFYKVHWNLRAIGATIGALRTIERHGTTALVDQAFSGFAQLPAAGAAIVRPWREVLGLVGAPAAQVTREGLLNVYRQLARTHHPDLGGDAEKFKAITEAYQDALREIGA
jgi:hypothetical protein